MQNYQIITSNQDSDNLQIDVGKSKEWAIIWKMQFNIKKCRHLHIGPSIAEDYYMPSELGIVPIEKVKEQKDLQIVSVCGWSTPGVHFFQI